MTKIKDMLARDHTYEDVKMWNNFKFLIDNEANYTIETIENSIAEKYAHDLYGLFLNHFGVERNSIYIHMLVNGFTCSHDYDGEKVSFKILNLEAVEYARSMRG